MLELRDLQIAFKEAEGLSWGVSGVDLCIHPGESLVLLGESGSGKTLTALSLIQLLPQGAFLGTEARYKAFGFSDLFALSEDAWSQLRGRAIAMVFQDALSSMNPVRTIEQHFQEALKVRRALMPEGSDSKEAPVLGHDGAGDPHLSMTQQSLLWLSKVELDGERILKAYPHQCSGGMRQRIGLALALATGAKVLIADEPTTALDPSTQDHILKLIRTLQKEEALTLVFITHDLKVAEHMADRIAVMFQGKIVEEAPAEDLLKKAKHPYTQALLASYPRMYQSLETPLEPDPTEESRACDPLCNYRFRCPQRFKPCDETPPPWRSYGAQRIRCHREDDALSFKILPPSVRTFTQQAPDPVLEVGSLCIDYGKVSLRGFRNVYRAVRDVSFTLHRGRTLGLMGSSGSGKSSIARAILGILASARCSGRILLTLKSGEKMDILQKPSRHIQWVSQDPYASLNPCMSVREMLHEAYHLQRKHAASQEASESFDAAATRILREVGLDFSKFWHRYPKDFSGGQRQRLAMARALLMRPEVLILDEPTSALDVSVQMRMLYLLAHLQKKYGLSYLLISHHLPLLSSLAHDVVVLEQGTLVHAGDARTLEHDFAGLSS